MGEKGKISILGGCRRKRRLSLMGRMSPGRWSGRNLRRQSGKVGNPWEAAVTAWRPTGCSRRKPPHCRIFGKYTHSCRLRKAGREDRNHHRICAQAAEIRRPLDKGRGEGQKPIFLIFLDKISSALNNHAEMKEKNTVRTDFPEESGKWEEAREWAAI